MTYKKTVKYIMVSAIICSLLLTSCGSDLVQNARDDTTYNQTTVTTESMIPVQSQSDAVAASNHTESTSYNAFLYSTVTSLSEPVKSGEFGFDMSKNNDNADRRLQNAPYQNTKITLSREHYEEFVDAVNAETINYKYAGLYDIENAMEKVNAYADLICKQSDQYTDLICDIRDIPSETVLENRIMENNQEYLAAHANYDAISNDYIALVAGAIVDVLTAYHDDLDEVTLKKIYSMLADVKVVGIDSGDYTKNDLKTVFNASVTDDGVVALDLEEIDKIRQENGLKKTIYHEVVHLFQRQAPDARIDGFTQIGGSQYVDAFDDTGEVNSLHYLWLYEASAEYMSMGLSESKTPLVYKNMVGYLNTLNLITLIRPDCTEDSIAISQMSNNPDKIFEILGVDTPEERNEIRNMLYSICCISDDREDFSAVYDKQYGSGSFTEQADTVKNEMRTGIAKTMTKLFYRNLAERVANTDVTMEDLFYLINVFEGALSRHLWYDDESLYSMFEDTMRYYVETQNRFFEYIAQDSGYTYDQIAAMFGDFAMVYMDSGNYYRNCSFTWLDEDEKSYVGDVFTTNLKDFTINIREVYSK